MYDLLTVLMNYFIIAFMYDLLTVLMNYFNTVLMNDLLTVFHKRFKVSFTHYFNLMLFTVVLKLTVYVFVVCYIASHVLHEFFKHFLIIHCFFLSTTF
ncbi:hypothetical protein TVAGG3_0796280 [Trichomonas vaginalis G3]|nr:hypothetical protein TVAGG3_0796280 [Trichomonas vaginalis G3]KAI5496187.1 hypothetical protein TVAGG3_0796280 [Trichomonas vaginalis G3]